MAVPANGLFEPAATSSSMTARLERIEELRRQLDIEERALIAELATQTRAAVDADPAAKPAEKKHHAIKACLTHFDQRHREKLSAPAIIMGAKDAPLMKRIIDTHGEQRTIELIDEFFKLDDEWITQNTGYTVGAFSKRVPSLISRSAVAVRTHGITPRTQHNRTSSTTAAALIRRNFPS